MNENTNTSLKMGENANAPGIFSGLKTSKNVDASGISRNDSDLRDAFEGLSGNLDNLSPIGCSGNVTQRVNKNEASCLGRHTSFQATRVQRMQGWLR